ncbi:protein of unknown function [Pararobbsia alpina]
MIVCSGSSAVGLMEPYSASQYQTPVARASFCRNLVRIEAVGTRRRSVVYFFSSTL